MNHPTPAELLTVASALYPAHLAGESDTEKLQALRKTLRLFELAGDVLNDPDGDIREAAQLSDEILPYNHPEVLNLAGIKFAEDDEPNQLAKRAYEKARRRAEHAGFLPPQPVKVGISRGAAQTLFSVQITPGPQKRPSDDE